MKTIVSIFLIFSYINANPFFKSINLAFKFIFPSIVAINCTKKINKSLEKEERSFQEKYVLISLADPEFYEFCNDIRIRMGIKQEVEFRFFDNSNENDLGFYMNGIIYINKEAARFKDSIFLDTVVHELEHYRQINGYAGSYNGSNKKQLEGGADAAAAGFIECIECLKKNKSYSSQLSKKKLDDLRKKGYFLEDDYECYLDRLKENPKVCDACFSNSQNIKWKDFVSFRKDSAKKDFYLHSKNFKSLDESFTLPQIKNNKVNR